MALDSQWGLFLFDSSGRRAIVDRRSSILHRHEVRPPTLFFVNQLHVVLQVQPLYLVQKEYVGLFLALVFVSGNELWYLR